MRPLYLNWGEFRPTSVKAMHGGDLVVIRCNLLQSKEHTQYMLCIVRGSDRHTGTFYTVRRVNQDGSIHTRDLDLYFGSIGVYKAPRRFKVTVTV